MDTRFVQRLVAIAERPRDCNNWNTRTLGDLRDAHWSLAKQGLRIHAPFTRND
jgi:hypothetical protein